MKRRISVLIVDDEKHTREGLARALQAEYRVLLADNAERALAMLEEEPVDLVLSDIRMPGMDGMALLRRLRAREPQPTVILLTAYGSIETAVEAMKAGAYDFLAKPVSLDRLDILLRRAIETREIKTENSRLHEQLDARYGVEHIVGDSPPMREVIATLRQVAPARATVLIEGESGTGKELVAQAVHRLSPRRDNPFMPVHCAALSPSLLESELFGHERGAFTGAVEKRIGRFELADGGTLFLDEIGDIAPAVQVKILRALEERRIERVGSGMPVDVDVRLIAATNRTLRDMVDRGEFREDLYFRLNVVSIVLPPLRERAGDIPILAARFVAEMAEENGVAPPGLHPDTVEALIAYAWPGNVRELRNTIERMIVLSRGKVLMPSDLPPALRPSGARSSAGAASALGGLTMEEGERRLIEFALEAARGNRVQAARQLGISRRTLHRKIKTYGLEAVGRTASKAI